MAQQETNTPAVHAETVLDFGSAMHPPDIDRCVLVSALSSLEHCSGQATVVAPREDGTRARV